MIQLKEQKTILCKARFSLNLKIFVTYEKMDLFVRSEQFKKADTLFLSSCNKIIRFLHDKPEDKAHLMKLCIITRQKKCHG